MARQQLQVLNAIQMAKTQLYHFTAIVIAGMGFFTHAYNLFCIPLVSNLLGRIYYHVPGSPLPGTLPPSVSAAVNGAAICGTLSGQLFFGWLREKMSRKKAHGMTLMLMVICSIASGLSSGHTAKGVMATLCFFRFWLGFGIGGDCPLSATVMCEYANKKNRGAFIAAVFAMQGFGILGCGITTLIVSSAFKAKYNVPSYNDDVKGSTVPQADYVWRLIFMLGAIPAALTYYWRMKMPETARYTALQGTKDAKQASADMSKVLQLEIEEDESKVEMVTSDSDNFGLLSVEFARRHGLHLLGTTSTWFLLNVVLYSQILFQKDIFSAVGWIPEAQTVNAIDEVFCVARAQTLIALCATVPGYWFTVALIDHIGRFTIQVIGFFMMTVFMLSLAIPHDDHWMHHDNRAGFVIMYAHTFFFANFGPNSTTFIAPAEIFPARLRSTCHSISAAAGKVGAIVGSVVFLYALQDKDPVKTDTGYKPGIGLRNSLFVLAACNLLGLLLTFLVPETKEKSPEEMSGENDEERSDAPFFHFGVERFWRSPPSSNLEMRKVTAAVLSISCIFTAVLLRRDMPQEQNHAACTTRVCPAGRTGTAPLPRGVAAVMLMLALSSAFLSWCCLTVTGQQPHRIGGFRRALADHSVASAVCAWFAAVGTIIGSDPLSSISWVQVAGGGWTLAAVIVRAWAATVCVVWKLIRFRVMTPNHRQN